MRCEPCKYEGIKNLQDRLARLGIGFHEESPAPMPKRTHVQELMRTLPHIRKNNGDKGEDIVYRYESAKHYFDGMLGAMRGEFQNLCPICGKEGKFLFMEGSPNWGMFRHDDRTDSCTIPPHILSRCEWFPKWKKDRDEYLAKKKAERDAEYERQYWQDVEREMEQDFKKELDSQIDRQIGFDYTTCPKPIVACVNCPRAIDEDGMKCPGR